MSILPKPMIDFLKSQVKHLYEILFLNCSQA